MTAAASPAPGLPPGIVIRPLEGPADLAACLEVQRAVWGDDPRELVPPIVLEATRHAGGLLGGACDAGGRLLGIVYGMPAIRSGRPAHWSHLLAVRPEARRLGLGLALKLWQRDRLREQGIYRVFWSYDPLLAANAHLNLNLLGARVIEYVEDMYGDEIQGTAGSDRLIVEWDLAAPAAPAEADAALVLHPNDEALPAAARLGVAVPPDFTALVGSDPRAALRWRLAGRRAFTHYLSAGYRVAGFRRGGQAHYVLEERE
jgi:predicted GNAT superfamily acetyltransferase